MIKGSITCKELPRVQAYFQRKEKEAPFIAGQVAMKCGLLTINELKLNAPKWSSKLATVGIQGRLVLFKYMARYWVTFPLPYTQFANSGRRASYPKNAKVLRWYKTPHSSTGKIFAKYSPPTGDFANTNRFKTGNQTHFIERTVATISPQLQTIAELELRRWLMM